jgi:hypothetical protein
VSRNPAALPENAVVICVDEKTSIPALERAQGYLKLPDGRALSPHSRECKRKRHLDPACCLRGGHRQVVVQEEKTSDGARYLFARSGRPHEG